MKESQDNVAKTMDCFQPVVSKTWLKFKRNGKIMKRKHIGKL